MSRLEFCPRKHSVVEIGLVKNTPEDIGLFVPRDHIRRGHNIFRETPLFALQLSSSREFSPWCSNCYSPGNCQVKSSKVNCEDGLLNFCGLCCRDNALFANKWQFFFAHRPVDLKRLVNLCAEQSHDERLLMGALAIVSRETDLSRHLRFLQKRKWSELGNRTDRLAAIRTIVSFLSNLEQPRFEDPLCGKYEPYDISETRLDYIMVGLETLDIYSVQGVLTTVTVNISVETGNIEENLTDLESQLVRKAKIRVCDE